MLQQQSWMVWLCHTIQYVLLQHRYLLYNM